MEGIIFVSPLASNFVYILISEFKRDIGLKLAGVFGSLPGFGKVTICALSISWGKDESSAPCVKTDRRYSKVTVFECF